MVCVPIFSLYTVRGLSLAILLCFMSLSMQRKREKSFSLDLGLGARMTSPRLTNTHTTYNEVTVLGTHCALFISTQLTLTHTHWPTDTTTVWLVLDLHLKLCLCRHYAIFMTGDTRHRNVIIIYCVIIRLYGSVKGTNFSRPFSGWFRAPITSIESH